MIQIPVNSRRCALTRPHSILLPIVLATLSAPLLAQQRECGTDWDTTRQIEQLHRAHKRPAAQQGDATVARAEPRNGVFIVPKSEETALFDHPNDLDGKSLRFSPSGSGYVLAVEPLQYDDEIGAVLRTFSVGGTDWHYAKYDLHSVTLPLFGQTVRTIYVTAFNGISLTPPRISSARQLDRVEAAITPEPTIAPLLMANNRPDMLALPTAWIRETAEGVIVTWRTSTSKFSYDVQASIARSGEIVFSYRRLDHVSWGAVLITPGASWFSALNPIASAEDAADDVAAGVPAALRRSLDIRTVTVQRAAGTGLYRIAVGLGAIPGSALPSPGDGARLSMTIGDAPPMTLTLGFTGGPSVSEPGRAIPGSSTVSLDSAGVKMLFFSDLVGPADVPRQIVIETSLLSMSVPADRLVMDASISAGALPGVDLNASNGTELTLPIVEAFTLPVVDLQEVWEIARESSRLTDGYVDAVAIYQDFYSDIILYAGAYAVGGNPQADGVSKYVSKRAALPRSPTLMNMNRVGWTDIEDPRPWGRTLLHEFGHRWLQFVETIENGSRTISLNPAPAHPPQYACRPAAFPVMTAYDTSTMGGGYFTQAGNTFTTAAASPYGYSWLDLYLMGLAGPEEVPPMYYIAGTNPPLGDSYTPPGNITVTGTRRNVTMQQVVDAMGPRTPQSQRSFNVVFVLVTSASEPSSADLARMDGYRRAFEENFSKATGNRADVRTLHYPPAPRRRSVSP